MQLCAIGAADDSRQALEELQGKKANKRIIKIRYLDSETQIENRLSTCHLLYRPLYAAPLKLPEQLPAGMLLVVDEPANYYPSIAITLTKNEEGRIEFGINQTAVSNSGLVISSQLLKLAKEPRYGEDDK